MAQQALLISSLMTLMIFLSLSQWIWALHIRTCALLSVTEMRGDGDGASLPNADSDQALIHAGDHVASTHVCVIGTITRVAEERKILGK